jgi:hypothetical protein
MQVAGTVLPVFGAPNWLPGSIVILLAIGLLPALIFSWVFEMTPQGLKRDEDVRPGELIVLASVIGFPIALVIAWAFELTAGSKQLR